MNLEPFVVVASADMQSVTMRRGAWSVRCPVDNLAAWLRFYRSLIARRPESARFYSPAVTAIERAMRRLNIPVPPESRSEPAERKAKR